MKEISLIILAYNDIESLKELIPKSYKTLKDFFDRFEIIVVDDKSNDGTEELMTNLLDTFDHLVYYRNEINQGVGYTFQKGVSLSNYDIIAYTDGDGQYEVSDLLKMFPLISKFDIVSGYRKHRTDGAMRLFQSLIYNRLLKILFDNQLKDTNSGLKMYNAKVLKHLLPLKNLNSFFDAEIVIKAHRAGFTIKEFDIVHYSRKFGVPSGGKLKTILECIYSLVKFYYEK